MAFDATEGGANATSYCTVDFADNYFEARLYSDTWTGTSDDDKEIALMQATTRLEFENYRGARATASQALKWPRSGITVDGVAIDDATIPASVKKACCEAAIALLDNEDAFSGSDDLEGFSSIQIGDARFDLKGGANDALPAPAKAFLAEFLTTATQVIRH